MQVSRVINVTQQVSFNEMVLMDWPTDLHFPFDTRHDSNKSSIKTDEVKDSSVRIFDDSYISISKYHTIKLIKLTTTRNDKTYVISFRK